MRLHRRFTLDMSSRWRIQGAVAHSDWQIIAGRRDPAVPPINAEFLHERLPCSKFELIDAGHFTWEEATDDFAALVTQRWGGGYTDMASATVH
jgi:pimeloyl-ACP methyl ester carboxylesterase